MISRRQRGYSTMLDHLTLSELKSHE
uniref:AsnS2 n=1 Tax=Arundo donax TaxID=35708 RepID=A0A0A9B5B7_ARUDO